MQICQTENNRKFRIPATTQGSKGKPMEKKPNEERGNTSIVGHHFDYGYSWIPKSEVSNLFQTSWNLHIKEIIGAQSEICPILPQTILGLPWTGCNKK